MPYFKGPGFWSINVPFTAVSLICVPGKEQGQNTDIEVTLQQSETAAGEKSI